MSMLGGRGGRSDDWASPHDRARFRAAERLEAPLAADEARWLEEHLAGCAECAAIADDYDSQRNALRALRDRQPEPPRDLWARTAAAIEREPRPRSRRPAPRGRSLLATYTVLAGAMVVAVVYGVLSSSRLPIGPATTAPAPTGATVAASQEAVAGPTPMIVAPQDVAYLSVEDNRYHVLSTRVDRVCPDEAASCLTSEPTEVVDIGPLSSPATVFGSADRPLVIVGGEGGSIIAIDPSTASPAATPTPAGETPTPTAPAATPTAPVATPSPTPTSTASQLAASASIQPSIPPSTSPSVEPTATPQVTASPIPGGGVEIARDLVVVDSTAAYAPDGSAFAFTAVPADGSHGPDIYVWTVGDTTARAVTSDHRSVFGSWEHNSIVGSRVATSDGTGEPAAFILPTPDTAPVFRPETGLVWRPVVDPTGGSAVYWSGTVEASPDGTTWTAASGALVIGRWGISDSSADPEATPPGDDQADARMETTIATGPLDDWDVRWDEAGTRLAIWIADPDDPSVGRLSLYLVDPFDGRIDLANPPLSDEPALAGFSMADGRLAWASPGDSGRSSRVRVLAWTDEDFGQVESAPGDFILVR